MKQQLYPNRAYGRVCMTLPCGIGLLIPAWFCIALLTAVAFSNNPPPGEPDPPKECDIDCGDAADQQKIRALIEAWGDELKKWDEYNDVCGKGNDPDDYDEDKCKAWQKQHGQRMAAMFYCSNATLLPTVGKGGIYTNMSLLVNCPNKVPKEVCPPPEAVCKAPDGQPKDCPNTIAQYFACDFLPKQPILEAIHQNPESSRVCVTGNIATYIGLYVFQIRDKQQHDQHHRVGARFTFVLVKTDNEENPWRIYHHHSSADPKFVQKGDLNGDGKVDHKDLQKLICNWGEQAPAPPPPPADGRVSHGSIAIPSHGPGSIETDHYQPETD